jgi:hypothetical protein
VGTGENNANHASAGSTAVIVAPKQHKSGMDDDSRVV